MCTLTSPGCAAVTNAERPRGSEVELGTLNRLFLLRVKLKVCFETSLNLNFELIFSLWCLSSCSGFSATSSRRVCWPVLPELGLVVFAFE